MAAGDIELDNGSPVSLAATVSSGYVVQVSAGGIDTDGADVSLRTDRHAADLTSCFGLGVEGPHGRIVGSLAARHGVDKALRRLGRCRPNADHRPVEFYGSLVGRRIKSHQRPVFAARHVVSSAGRLREDHIACWTIGTCVQQLVLLDVVSKELDAFVFTIESRGGSAVIDQPVGIEQAVGNRVMRHRSSNNNFGRASCRIGSQDPIALVMELVGRRADRSAVCRVVQPAVAAHVESGVNLAGCVVARRQF